MRTKKRALTFLLFAGIILFTAQSAFGGCEVAFLDDLIDLEGNAPGTKYEGPITIFFDTSPYVPGSFQSDMYYFLRLRKGTQRWAFSGVQRSVDYRPIDLDIQVAAIETFFRDTVIPVLYNNCGILGCPEVVLKSYSLDVNQSDPGTSDFIFYVVDIVIAVQD